jgi:parallel beta-helix repeat protein
MTKVYIRIVQLSFLLIASLASYESMAQTTLATPVPSGLVYYSDTEPGVIVFGVKNTNSYGIVVTDLSSYVEPGYGDGSYTLWYHTSAVTGAPSATTAANGWIQATPPATLYVTSTGVTPILSGLNITIPAGATYRFALQCPVKGPYYGTSGSTADIVSAGGVDLYLQNNPLSPTYSGAFGTAPTLTPRSFYGSITFSQATTCGSITPGVAVNLSARGYDRICEGSSFSLALTGNSIGTGQTYQWQSSPDNVSWTNSGSASADPVFTTSQTATTFYRAVITCGTSTNNSGSIQVFNKAPLSPAIAYTINKNQPTGGANFNSFRDAVDALGCGVSGAVVISVQPGTGPYTEQISIPAIPGASATNRIRIMGNGETIQAAPGSASRYIVKLDGVNYLTLDSLKIIGTATDYGWGIHFTNGANNDSIRACTIDVSAVTSTTTDYSAGIVVSDSPTDLNAAGNASNNIIVNNTIKGGYQGVIINGATSGAGAVANIVRNNVIQDFYANGIELADAEGTIVEGNDINRSNRSAGSSATTVVTTFSGVQMNGATANSLIIGNRIHDTHTAAGTDQADGAYGIYSTGNDVAAGSENKVINNVIYNFNSTTGVQYGLYNSSSNGIFYYHNTVVLDEASSTSGTTRGFYQTTTATGIQLRNNIFYVTRAGTGTKHGMYFGTTTSDILSNNNVFYVNASGSTVGVGSFGTANAATLADWQAVNGSAYDQQSVYADPMFTGSGNFTPQNALINGIGANLGITTDILGNSRSASPDPGAYEFTVAGLDADISWIAPVMPVTAGLKTITVNITNTQTTPLTSVNLSYTDGTTVQTQSFTGLNIAAGGSQQLSFTAQYNLTQNVVMKAYINTVNGTADNNRLNDTTATQNLCLALSGYYTINSAVTTANRNFQNFTDVVNQLGCGGISGPVVFEVAPGSGPYNEQIVIPQITGASSINRVRFLGNGAIIQFAAVTADRHIIKLDGADYVTIDSMKIQTTSITYGWGIHFANGANNDSIRACTIDVSAVTSTTTDYSAGIVVSDSPTDLNAAGNASNNVIVNNTIKGGYQGIILNGATAGAGAVTNIIRGNTIQDFYTDGIELADADGTIVEGNDINRSNRSAGSSATTVVSTFAGIEMNGTTMNSLIIGNRIHDTHTAAGTDQADGAYGIYSTGNDVAAGSENKVINNVIYNFNSTTGAQYGLYNSSSNGIFYYHNTVVLDEASSTSGTTRGFYQTTTATGIELRNNIFYVRRAGTGTKHGVYFGTTTSDILSNNNVFYVNAPGSTVGVGSFGTANAATLADWQAVNSGVYDRQSVYADPMFTSGINFTPTESLVNNTGVGVGVTTDINGASRSATSPDAGAYEWTAALPVTLASFTGVQRGDHNELTWITANEVNNRGFELQRSADGINFSSLAFVPTKASAGTSSISLSYNYYDEKPFAGSNYYRLKQVDKDGRSKYSVIVLLSRGIGTVRISNVYPNPVMNGLSLVITSPRSEKLLLVVTDISGKQVWQATFQVLPGDNKKIIDVERLAAGTYILKTICISNGDIQQWKFLKR